MKKGILLVSLLMLIGIGCSDDDTANQPPNRATRPDAPIENIIFARDQELTNNQILIESVVANKDGWIALYKNDNNKPGDLLGVSPVARGINDYIFIDVEEENLSAKVFILLHNDTGTIGTFDYPENDSVVRNGEDKTISKTIQVIPPEQKVPSEGKTTTNTPPDTL